MDITFFSSTYAVFDSQIESFLGDKLTAVTAIVRGPLAVSLTIYLVLVGYAVLRGLVDEPWREWFYRILKLALVWAAVTSSGYQEWLATPLGVDAPNAITQALSGSTTTNVGSTFDAFFNHTDAIQKGLDAEADQGCSVLLK